MTTSAMRYNDFLVDVKDTSGSIYKLLREHEIEIDRETSFLIKRQIESIFYLLWDKRK